MFLQKIANLFRSRKFWALILSFITITSAAVMGEINFWQFMQAALVALAIFSTGIAIEDMANGWRTPGEQHIYDTIMFSIPEQIRMILTSRKFWILLTAIATAASGYLTDQLTIWQFAQAVVASLSVYSSTVAIDDSGRKENSLGLIREQLNGDEIPF